MNLLVKVALIFLIQTFTLSLAFAGAPGIVQCQLDRSDDILNVSIPYRNEENRFAEFTLQITNFSKKEYSDQLVSYDELMELRQEALDEAERKRAEYAEMVTTVEINAPDVTRNGSKQNEGKKKKGFFARLFSSPTTDFIRSAPSRQPVPRPEPLNLGVRVKAENLFLNYLDLIFDEDFFEAAVDVNVPKDRFNLRLAPGYFSVLYKSFYKHLNLEEAHQENMYLFGIIETKPFSAERGPFSYSVIWGCHLNVLNLR